MRFDLSQRPVLPPAVATLASVILERAFPFITVPLLATFLKPGDYGRPARVIMALPGPDSDMAAMVTSGRQP